MSIVNSNFGSSQHAAAKAGKRAKTTDLEIILVLRYVRCLLDANFANYEKIEKGRVILNVFLNPLCTIGIKKREG